MLGVGNQYFNVFVFAVPALNIREKVFLRHVDLISKRSETYIRKRAVNDEIIAANGGDAKSATSVKYYRASEHIKFCKNVYHPHTWVPHAFGTKIIREELSGNVL